MAFESLTDKLQNVFKKLKGKGRLTEADVKVALKEVKMALLEADVNFKVVKQFTKSVQEKAIGQDVMNGLNPGQMVIKIVNDELVNLMGSETTELPIKPGMDLTVLMMVGLQGAGKTTTVAKLAGKLKSKGKKPLLVACDVYRPAAITQLQVNGEKQGVEVFSRGSCLIQVKPFCCTVFTLSSKNVTVLLAFKGSVLLAYKPRFWRTEEFHEKDCIRSWGLLPHSFGAGLRGPAQPSRSGCGNDRFCRCQPYQCL